MSMPKFRNALRWNRPQIRAGIRRPGEKLARSRRWRAALLLAWLLPTLALGASTRSVTLILKDADISAFISTVSEVTGKNFIVDPRVQGKVTVMSARALESEELYQVFLSVLRVHGFAAVQAGEVVKIVPEESARVDSNEGTNRPPARGDELVTRVVSVHEVSAEKLVPVLRPLVPQQGHLAAYAPSNALIISDRAGNVDRILKIIRRVDVLGPDDIEVIALEHASASEVARILTALSPKPDDAAAELRVVADDRTNSLLLSAGPASRLRLRTLVAHLDTPLEGTGNTQVVYLKHARASDLVPILEGVSGQLGNEDAGEPGSEDREPTAIQADPTMNALVITAAPTMLRSLLTVVRQLDVARAQVLVEAVIADVSTDVARELGVQWRTTTKPQESGAFGGTSFSGTSAINQLSINPLGLGSGLSLGIIDGTFTFRGQEFLNIGLLIRALASDSSTNILSTPSVVTLDNQEAEIIVAQNVPFITGQFTNTGTAESATNPFQTIERQDVGIILRVRPQINEGNRLKLDIEQEVSNIAAGSGIAGTTTTGAVDLVTTKRSIRTSVTVGDGKVVVLGGLITDDLQQSREKVPILGDIPLLGQLFRFDSSVKVEHNLMVFLRPVILLDDRSALVSSAKYNFLRGKQLEQREETTSLVPADAVPTLSPLAEFTRPPPAAVEAVPAPPVRMRSRR